MDFNESCVQSTLDGEDDQQEVELDEEHVVSATEDLRKAGGRSKSSRKRILDNVIDYFKLVFRGEPTEKTAQRVANLIPRVDILLVEIIKTLVPLRQAGKVDLEHTIFCLNGILENYLRQIYFWCCEESNERPSPADLFVPRTKSTMTSLVALIEAFPTWHYLELVFTAVFNPLTYVWSEATDAKALAIIHEWCVTMRKTMYTLEKIMVNCGDFYSQWILVSLMHQWLWSSKERSSREFLASVFPTMRKAMKDALLLPNTATPGELSNTKQTFVNNLNTSLNGATCNVISVPCFHAAVGDTVLRPFEGANKFWIDFSFRSRRMHCFIHHESEEKKEPLNILVDSDNVDSICVSWNRSNEDRSRYSQSQLVEASQMSAYSQFSKGNTSFSLILLHIHLKKCLDEILSLVVLEDGGPVTFGLHSQDMVLVFEDATLVERVISRLGWPTHKCGDLHSCTSSANAFSTHERIAGSFEAADHDVGRFATPHPKGHSVAARRTDDKLHSQLSSFEECLPKHSSTPYPLYGSRKNSKRLLETPIPSRGSSSGILIETPSVDGRRYPNLHDSYLEIRSKNIKAKDLDDKDVQMAVDGDDEDGQIAEDEHLQDNEDVGMSLVEDEGLKDDEGVQTAEDEDLEDEEGVPIAEDENLIDDEDVQTAEDEDLKGDEDVQIADDEDLEDDEGVPMAEDENLKDDEDVQIAEDENRKGDEDVQIAEDEELQDDFEFPVRTKSLWNLTMETIADPSSDCRTLPPAKYNFNQTMDTVLEDPIPKSIREQIRSREKSESDVWNQRRPREKSESDVRTQRRPRKRSESEVRNQHRSREKSETKVRSQSRSREKSTNVGGQRRLKEKSETDVQRKEKGNPRGQIRSGENVENDDGATGASVAVAVRVSGVFVDPYDITNDEDFIREAKLRKTMKTYPAKKRERRQPPKTKSKDKPIRAKSPGAAQALPRKTKANAKPIRGKTPSLPLKPKAKPIRGKTPSLPLKPNAKPIRGKTPSLPLKPKAKPIRANTPPLPLSPLPNPIAKAIGAKTPQTPPPLKTNLKDNTPPPLSSFSLDAVNFLPEYAFDTSQLPEDTFDWDNLDLEY